jgi:uncharacterized protein (UPF0548 family)
MRIRLSSPTDEELDLLAERMAARDPTYPGSASGHFREDRWSRALRPTTTWDAAKTALGQWRAHRGAGVRVRPSVPPHKGQTVALAIRVGPVFFEAPCRVTSTVDEPDRFGFTYATLPGHPEEGEEAFLLSRDERGRVVFDVTAISRPADLMTRLGGPVSRLLQRSISDRYLRLDGLG